MTAKNWMRKSGKVWQFLAGCTASVCFFGGAAAYVWVNPMLLLLLSHSSPVPMTSAQASWVATLPEIGTIFTAVPSGWLADAFGRKPLMLIVGPLQIIPWIVIYFTDNIIVLCAMRLIQGLLLGITSTALPLYLGEIAEPKIRGALGNLFVLSFNLGQLYEYLFGAIVSYKVLIGLSTLPFIIFMVGFVWFAESPYYLLMKNKEEAARRALRSFRDEGHDVETELAEMKASIQEERAQKSSWKDIFSERRGRKALFLMTFVSTTTFMSGYNALVSYSSYTFRKMTDDDKLSSIFTIIMGVVLCVASLFVALFLDRAGRRPTLFWSHVTCAVCLLPVAVYYLLQDCFSVDVSQYSWVPVAGIVLSPTMICASISAVRVYQTEIFNNATRGFASGLATVFLGVASSISIRMYEALDSAGLMWLNFAIFGIFCIVGALYTWFQVPETKGKTFEEIQKML